MDFVEGLLVGGAVVGGVAGGVVMTRELRRHHVGDSITRVGTSAAEQAGRVTAGTGRLVGSMLDWSGSAARTTSAFAGKGMTAAGRTVASATGSLLGTDTSVTPAPVEKQARTTRRRAPLSAAS
jgi:hypothetical protein